MSSELIIDGQVVSLSENQEQTTAESTTTAVVETANPEGQQDDEAANNDGATTEGTPALEEYSLTVGDEEIPLQPADDENIDGKPAPQWVKDLRKGFKEQQRENRELKRQLEEIQTKPAEQASQVQSDVVIAKPTLESCEYDEERYEQELTQWHEKKTHADKAKQQQVQQQQQFQQRLQQRLQEHQQRASQLPVKDYAEVEEIVRREVPRLHQEVLLHAADEGTELIAYALGKNPQLRQRLIAETDPIRAAFQLGQLSAKVKLAPKVTQNAKPEPEIKGGAGNAKSDEFNKLCPGAVIE